jgi:hypothetical protein
MAGELLMRIVDRTRFDALGHHDRASRENVDKTFLDGGKWSLIRPSGDNYVVIDGSAFFVDAPWMYENHHAFEELPLENVETATLLIPNALVLEWKRRLRTLPLDGEVARNCPEIRDALVGMIDMVLKHANLTLTVQSLL